MVRTSSAPSTARWRMTSKLSTSADEHASAGAAIGGLGAGGLGGGVMLGAAASDDEGAEVDEVISGAGVSHLNIRSKHLGASSSCRVAMVVGRSSGDASACSAEADGGEASTSCESAAEVSPASSTAAAEGAAACALERQRMSSNKMTRWDLKGCITRI